MTAAEVVELAVAVQDAGFDRLGISDVVLWPDCFMLLALCAEATSRVKVGALVTNPYSRPAVMLAGAHATLDDVSGGRAFCGLGVGAGLEVIGCKYERPVGTLRDAIDVVRERLPAMPIAIGTRSPQIMALAGEVADIALIGARYWSAEIVKTYWSWLEKGASRAGRCVDDIDIAPRLTVCVSEDGDLARRSIKRYVAHYLCLLRPTDLDIDPATIDVVESVLDRATGWYFDHDRFDPPELDDLIDDALCTEFAIVGTPDECVGQLSRIVDLGFTSLSMNLAAVRRDTMYEGLRETIAGLTSAMPEIRELV